MPAWIPAAISGAASIIGGLFNRKSDQDNTDASNKQQRMFIRSERKMADREARHATTRAMGYNTAERLAAQGYATAERGAAERFTANQAGVDRAMQERFAKESAGWQFEDLMEAADESGIHRLAALGAGAGQSYQPVGATSSPGSVGFTGVSPITGAGGGSYNPATVLGGSIVGDGMNAIADIMASEADYQRQSQLARQEATERQQDRVFEQAERAARMEVMSAEAEMYRAQSRTAIRSAQSPGNSPPPVDYASPDQPLYQTYIGTDGVPRTIPVGPDPESIAAGLGIEVYSRGRSQVEKDVRKVKEAQRKNKPRALPSIFYSN